MRRAWWECHYPRSVFCRWKSAGPSPALTPASAPCWWKAPRRPPPAGGSGGGDTDQRWWFGGETENEAGVVLEEVEGGEGVPADPGGDLQSQRQCCWC